MKQTPRSSPTLTMVAQDDDAAQRKYERANALVTSIFNKYYNGSARAVDPFVVRCLQEEEPRLLGLQCYLEQGPAEQSRGRKQSNTMENAVSGHAPPTLLSRLFGLCGSGLLMNGPGSIMREWDAVSQRETSAGGDAHTARAEYIAVVDRILPGWDHSCEYPIAQQHKFWQDDAAVTHCPSCGVCFSSSAPSFLAASSPSPSFTSPSSSSSSSSFSSSSLLPPRRHHCRLCLDIYCSACCSASVEMALCPGAPVRLQRVCASCLQDYERMQQLREGQRMLQDNRELEQRLREIQSATEKALARGLREEVLLRERATLAGCDLQALDTRIQGLLGGSPMPLHVRPPPAHRFMPREASLSVDANEQLALAHRQLRMGVKVAQCRASRVLQKMDVTLQALREALVFHGSQWHVLLRAGLASFLVLRELRVLAFTNRSIREGVVRYRCEAKCIAWQPWYDGEGEGAEKVESREEIDGRVGRLRAMLWLRECLQDAGARTYLTDLAKAVRAQTADSSDSSGSETDDDSDELTKAKSQRPLCDAVACGDDDGAAAKKLTTAEATARAVLTTTRSPSSPWSKVYAFIRSRCDASPAALEFDAQIDRDVRRTFGVSASGRSRTSSASTVLTTTLAQRQDALRNVLRAFSSVNSEVGYCQGLDRVAALLLTVTNGRESDAFWLLTSLVAAPRYQLERLWAPRLLHLGLRIFQLEKLMKRHLPEVYTHLTEMEYPTGVFATGWFLTLFSNMETLPHSVVLRVWDGFLILGWKHLFRVALAILHGLQPHLLESSFEELPQVFRELPSLAPQLMHPSSLLAIASQFKVTTSQLQALEREHETALTNANRKKTVVVPQEVTSESAETPTPTLTQEVTVTKTSIVVHAEVANGDEIEIESGTDLATEATAAARIVPVNLSIEPPVHAAVPTASDDKGHGPDPAPQCYSPPSPPPLTWTPAPFVLPEAPDNNSGLADRRASSPYSNTLLPIGRRRRWSDNEPIGWRSATKVLVDSEQARLARRRSIHGEHSGEGAGIAVNNAKSRGSTRVATVSSLPTPFDAAPINYDLPPLNANFFF